MDIGFKTVATVKSGAIVVFTGEEAKFTGAVKALDDAGKGSLSRTLKLAGFKAKFGEIRTLFAPAGSQADCVIFCGTRKEDNKKLTLLDVTKLGGIIYNALISARVQQGTVLISPFHDVSEDKLAARLAYGARLASFRFDKYFTKLEDDKKPKLRTLTFMLAKPKPAQDLFTKDLAPVAEGVFETRLLVSEPPNVINPESYAERCKGLKKYGLKVDVLTEKEMQRLGMGALLGVGQGSAFESRMVVMQWNGAPKSKKKPVAFVGKGVTFDSGGLSIKPSQGMEEMKYDMAGSAAVVGLMKALAMRKAKVNAVGVIGLVENMLGTGAQRPSDVVKTMSGQTIEVLNTDAEGRLVLADALWYTQHRFKPRFMVNLATLTGAIVVALSHVHAGLFSNNEELQGRILAAGRATGETLWPFPMDKAYDKMIDSKTADVQNISNDKGGGSITAAKFLERFVNNVPWAHLDIAGVAWTKKPKDIVPEGATGFGVRLLDQLVRKHYEE